MDSVTLAAEIKQRAYQLGLHVVGIASAEAFPEVEETLVARIRAGLMDGLPWFTEDRARFSSAPHNLMPQARSLISVAASYLMPESDGGGGADRAGGSRATRGAATTTRCSRGA